ncbi:MAG: MEMO1 family protein [Archaeoglobaceae archaeon]|nr:MEMO1 family protein [Archaeoglobaceae archaeon]MDW7989310.1 MEMO1 family protein [Archaeoglobaceae archaeon]
MRKSVVAGTFYPSRREELEKMLRRFTNPKKDFKIVACVSPHAGYIYSGKTAGVVHSMLPDAETFVIVCPNHTGYGLPVAVSKETWQTPLGKVESDLEFIEALPKDMIAEDEDAHSEEHSGEVQIPFLQYLHSNFKIIVICLHLQDEYTAKEVAKEIIDAENKTGRKIVVIASSDMHHYLPDIECRKRDKIVIDSVLSMNIAKYYRTIYEIDASVCGYGAIAVAMNYAKEKKANAELVDYSTSGEVSDKSFVVGYAGIVFRVQN